MPNFKEPTPVYKKSSGFKLRSGNSPLKRGYRKAKKAYEKKTQGTGYSFVSRKEWRQLDDETRELMIKQGKN